MLQIISPYMSKVLLSKSTSFFTCTLFELQNSNYFVTRLKLNINESCNREIPGFSLATSQLFLILAAFLLILAASQKILEEFGGLKSYFNSQKSCPSLIKKYFQEPIQDLCLKFVYEQLKYFNEAILKLYNNNLHQNLDKFYNGKFINNAMGRMEIASL